LAESTPAAPSAAPLPDEASVSRAEEFVRECFVLPGEDPQEALGPHSPRRWALDAALEELDGGAKAPSTEWRRRFSLLLGLERVLSDEEPKLADGTSLNPHQVDALSGTLTALLADAQRGSTIAANGGNGSANGHSGNGAPAPAAVAATVTGEDSDEEIDEDVPEDEEPLDYDAAAEDQEVEEAPEDPNAHKRFWFEHATGAGKTVAAMGFVDASRTGGILILTHRRNLVDQFNGELSDRGYKHRVCKPLLGDEDRADGPVTVETYQWFVRNAGNISSAYTVVICDEAHTALGEKTAAAIRAWTGPIFIGMTATGALIARHVTDLFPTQTSRFDLAQAARRGVIAPLRCVRIPPGPGVRTIAKVPLRRGEVDTEFDQELLAEPSRRRTSTRRASTACRASSTPQACATPTTSRRRSARRASRRRRCRARRRSASSPRRSPRTSAATSTCSSTPSCSPRAGTRRARPSASTSRRPPPSASTSSASAASPAVSRARRRASSSTSSTRARSTTTPS
jgi:hypothetical protein